MSVRFSLILSIASFLVFNQSKAFSQVVQLPTVSTFAYSGSVLVPDQGTIYLGGNNSSQSFSRQSGPSRVFGTQSHVGNTSVHAHIIDLEEIDRQIQGLPSSGRSVSSQPAPKSVYAHASRHDLRSSPVAGFTTRRCQKKHAKHCLPGIAAITT